MELQKQHNPSQKSIAAANRDMSSSESGDLESSSLMPPPVNLTAGATLAKDPSEDLDQEEVLQRQTDPHLRMNLTAHASPVWKNPGDSTPEQENLELSKERAKIVENTFMDLFTVAYATRGNPSYEVEELTCLVDETNPLESIDSEAKGSDETLVEAGGNTAANDPSMRRVDMKTRVSLKSVQKIQSSVPTTQSHWESHKSEKWGGPDRYVWDIG